MSATNLSPYNFSYQGNTYIIQVRKHILKFNFLARTSRGALQYKPTYFLRVQNIVSGETGIGECSPLQGLSLEFNADYEKELEYFCRQLSDSTHQTTVDKLENIQNFPSIRFGLEMALRDLAFGGKKILFDNPFTKYQKALPINGLVWMGDYDFMLEQMEEKLAAGFKCIKLKIGGIEFNKECSLLAKLRNDFSPEKITIRLDANGAFTKENAMEKLEKLAEFEVHSIEQPIRQGQLEAMNELCKNTPIPIALDEELIGINKVEDKNKLLDKINPQYIILKPSLIGGFRATEEWIALAEQRAIGWWITSALESNIGLNAIAQFTANYDVNIPQGLGTGQLYHNNIDSPLKIAAGELRLDQKKDWERLIFEA